MSTPEKPTPPQTTLEAKLEIPEDATPEQIVLMLEIEARTLSVLPDVYEAKETPANDMRAFAERTKKRIEVLNKLLKEQPGNPGLTMVKQLAGWRALAGDFARIPNFLTVEADWVENGKEEFWLSFSGEWPRFQRIFQAAKRLNAYIQPLISESDEYALSIRAIIATLNGITADLAKTFRPHGIEIDDVQILSSAPEDAKIDRANGEGFLIGGSGKTLPMKQMHDLIRAKQKETTETVVTDVRELGWSFHGEHRRETTVIPYLENTWLTGIGCYDIPEFRTH